MPKILLVEDDPLIAEIYMKKFASAGFEVVNVTTGKAVLKAVAEGEYDLVLLDLVIPEMSGMEVLEELRKNPKYPPHLKIIVFSNLSDPEDRKRAVDLGANGFIQKTEYTPSKLIVEVNRLLQVFSEQEKNENKSAAPIAKTGKRILFIEDEPVFVDMFGRRLAQDGYDIVSHENGLSGIEAAMKEHFDLIITDAMLPHMTGQEIIERLKTDEKTRHIPIFLLSASLEAEEMERLSQSSDVFKAFLKTQITPTELAREVESLFQNNG